MAIETNVNIKNVFTQIARIDTDSESSVWIGGGKSDARTIVGEEFAEITGGSRINFSDKSNELEGLLEAILNSEKREAPGLEGVELVSLSSDSFTIMFEGWLGSKNYIEFTGSHAEAAISGAQSPLVDLKNAKSQLAVFDTDDDKRIFHGSDADTDPEVKALLTGSSMNADEAQDLLVAYLTGQGERRGDGLDGLEVIGLTDDSYTLRINGSGDTIDTIIVEGDKAIEALKAADDARGLQFHDGRSSFDIFDVASERAEFVGGTKPAHIGEDFASLLGGRRILEDDVLEIFDALTNGNARQGDTGLDHVSLVGLNETSFSIAVESHAGQVDHLLFTNVHTLDGAADYGFYGL